ncbi:MAG: hypothetical protein NTY12_03695 [Candidatus Falkowbacteria bacterium]|nr:hypothetical protein [Candidatus Falkowbacteria bacterium]
MKAKEISELEGYKSVVRNSREHKLLAIKIARLTERVLNLFEMENSKDKRPRLAIEAIRAWGQGKMDLGMADVRKLSLDAHAAARAAKTDAARFAARAAGQAVATWHVPNHALAAEWYIGKIKLLAKK